MTNLTIERSIWIDAPRDRVWQAVTDLDQVVQWLLPGLPGAVLKRDETGKVVIYLGEMGLDFAILEAVEPPQKVTICSLPEQLITTTYTLAEREGGTEVMITMAGFEAMPQEMREDRQALSGVGWERTLQNLKACVEGQELAFPQAATGPLFGYWRQTGSALAVERSIWIDAPRERVWLAITDPKKLQEWFSPSTPWTLSALELGGRFYVFNEETKAEQYVEIIEVLDAPHQLATRAVPEPPDTVIKRKIYTLIEDMDGTRLIVTLKGYEPESEETRWGHMEENSVGFAMMLQNVKAYVEGKPLPFPWGF